MKIENIDYIDKRKCKITFEDGSAFPLYKGEVYKYGLEQNRILTEEEYKNIKYNIVEKRGRERAMYILKSADKTEKQLRIKLHQNMYPDDVVENIILFLKKHKYVDDVEYAKSFIKTYGGNLSRNVMGMKLRDRGIPKEIYDDLIDEYYETEKIDDSRTIYKLLEKKKYNENMDVKMKNRIISFLLRKGFDYQDIKECLNKFNKNQCDIY